MDIFERLESNVRGYCRSFPTVFEKASGSVVYSENGRRYLDLFAGAGALNYGHNNQEIKARVIEYFLEDNILHALDMYTPAKRHFLEVFEETILKPKGLNFKIQFCGPTGTNAVEAALKVARRVTGRTDILAFSGSYHGMTLGALSVSATEAARAAAGLPLRNARFAPYPNCESQVQDSIAAIEETIDSMSRDNGKPAACILETVQAEGGINVAPESWLKELRRICDQHGILLICDDIQVGCFRSGNFFSFERADIVPDLITLSKSISGIGFPMSILLMKPELDVWKPGEHTGTFRGHQLSFVGASAALEYANKIALPEKVRATSRYLQNRLTNEVAGLDSRIEVRGVGMIWGVDFSCINMDMAQRVSRLCFEDGMIIETAGKNDSVLKILPPLTISEEEIDEGCDKIIVAAKSILKSY